MVSLSRGRKPGSDPRLLINIFANKATSLHKMDCGDLGCIGDDSCECFRCLLIEEMEKLIHGGKRPGAGRKPREDGKGRTTGKSIKISRDVADYLDCVGTGVIEDMIRRSKSFRDWMRER